MNKRMREILAQIQAKTAEAQKYNTGADGIEKDTAKATALMDEVDALKKEYETEKRIFLPVFGDAQDETAVKRAEEVFDKKIIPVNINGIAEEGGGLNCISWEKN